MAHSRSGAGRSHLIRLRSSTPALLLALAAPTVIVASALLGAHSVHVAFAAYLLGGCVLGPWLLLGARPLSARGGMPWARAGLLVDRVGWKLWLLFGPVFFIVYIAIRRLVQDPERYLAQLRTLGWRDEHELLYGAAFLLLIPLFEEWWWRGQAVPRCVDRFGRRSGVIIAALAYAAYHAFTLAVLYEPRAAWLRWLAILVAGWAWSEIAWRRRQWSGVYLAHLGADMAIVAAFLLFVS